MYKATTKKILTCQTCGVIITSRHNTKYCCRECYINKPLENNYTIKCPTCGKLLQFPQCLANNNRGKYCSRSCYNSRPLKTLEQRFKQYVVEGTKDECWCWTGPTVGNYGNINMKTHEGTTINYKAHRVAMYLHTGVMPDTAAVVMHRCDNPKCCNPNHLRTGTQTENIEDMWNKGRAATKLQAAAVAEIKSLIADGNLYQKEIAKLYNVTTSTICAINKGRVWSNI